MEESLSYRLENRVYFCSDEVHTKKVKGPVNVIKLPSFQGRFDDDTAVDNYYWDNGLMGLETQAKNEKASYVLIAPNQQTAYICFVILRGWCTHIPHDIPLDFNQRGIIPLIEKPHG